MNRDTVRDLARELHPDLTIADTANVTFSADGSTAFVEAVLQVNIPPTTPLPAPVYHEAPE